jgi:hypothetical protein
MLWAPSSLQGCSRSISADKNRERAMISRIVVLTDDSDAIAFAKSGAPEPTQELLDWLARECKGAVRFEADSVFNVIFEFADVDDAVRFRARWAEPT